MARHGSPTSEYLSTYAVRFSQLELDQMLYWHALPEAWESMEYSEFLEFRRKLIAEVIRDGFTKLSHQTP